MRTFFEEGDLLVAEVQAFFADGGMYIAAAWWIALGAAGLWLRRRMLAADRRRVIAEATAPVAEGQAVPGSIIGSNLPRG